MKNICFLFLAIFATANIYSQTYTISFLATGNTTTLDSVKVENLTHPSTVKWYAGDVLQLILSNGINDLNVNEKSIQVFPNPMQGLAEISFYSKKAGHATLNIYDITGKEVLHTDDNLLQGRQKYQLTGLKQGLYLISIRGEGYLYTVKIISQNVESIETKIKKIGNENPEVVSSNLKSTKATVTMNYTTGDNIRFTGYSGSLISIVNDVPTGSKTISFIFIASLPTVTTTAATLITSSTVTSGGNVTAYGGAAVTARGVCYATTTNPTTANSTVANGSGTGMFTANITGLSANTTYYLRAYANNSVGTAYGNEISFSTTAIPQIPTVTTTAATLITSSTVTSGGNVTAYGGAAVTARGVCYATTTNPTTANSTVANGSGTGMYTANITGLTALTAYYVRAYATNSAGTAYGNQISFTTILNIPTSLIPAGTFTMGSPVTEVSRGSDEEEYQVTLSAFRMSKFQITNAQYAAFLNAKSIGSNGIYTAGAYPSEILIYPSSGLYNWSLHYNGSQWNPVAGYENHPVINVTWYGASEFATYAGGTLPTEAQWEYACRGNTTTPFYTGACLSNTQANYKWQYPYNTCTNTITTYPATTQAVGTYPANIYGLHDMHGNVWEWCSDWYGAYPTTAQTNPTGAATGSYRVTRNGSWHRGAQYCRSAHREFNSPDYTIYFIGFRVAFAP
ncbi:MAG: SUMF1/EgtB/PvdO family nonheme iron enzyme [Bacteroidales bacterium]